MISVSCVCVVWILSVGSFTADSQIISAGVGSTAVLPCEWRNVPVQTPHVQWNAGSETVFERKGVRLYEGEGYKNRVDVPQDKLLKGNCSLVLRNVRVTDAGVYESYVSVRRMKRASATKWILVQRVELAVEETAEELLQDISASTEMPEENVYERLTADAGLNLPPPQMVLLSLLTCLHVLHF